MKLQGITTMDQLADFDRQQGKTPIDPSRIEGADDFDPENPPEDLREKRRSDAQVSPLAALGRGEDAGEVAQDFAAYAPQDAIAPEIASASLLVLDTKASVDGQAVQLSEAAYAKIRGIVIDDAIEALKGKKAMLGLSGEKEARAVPPGTTTVRETAPRAPKKRCPECGSPARHKNTCSRRRKK